MCNLVTTAGCPVSIRPCCSFEKKKNFTLIFTYNFSYDFCLAKCSPRNFSVVYVVPILEDTLKITAQCIYYLNIAKLVSRGIRTITKLRLLTKIDFNIMHLVSLCKEIWQKLQIRGSRDLQFLAISDIFFQILRISGSKNAFN